jgi:hypothetical protein
MIIKPDEESIEKLSEVLLKSIKNGSMDLVWDAKYDINPLSSGDLGYCSGIYKPNNLGDFNYGM